MYERYCALRDSRNLSDYAVSKGSGVGRSTFSDWKSGRSEPGLEKLKKIADFFEVSVNYLLTGEVPDEPMTAQEKKLLTIFRNLSPAGQGMLMVRASELVELGYLSGKLSESETA